MLNYYEENYARKAKQSTKIFNNRERKKTDIKIKYRQKEQSNRSIEFVYDMYIQFNCVIYVVIISLG